jgi:hypothetical protein
VLIEICEMGNERFICTQINQNYDLQQRYESADKQMIAEINAFVIHQPEINVRITNKWMRIWNRANLADVKMQRKQGC